jgi:proprotein convertase subtilisin/kexin type 5
MCYCMNRYYQPLLAANASDPVCQPCYYTCLTCMHSTLCTACDTTNNTRYYNNGQCLCNIGFYDNSVDILCLPCHYTCLSCSSSSSCSSCNAIYNRVYNSSTTLCSCIRGYYDIGNSIDANCLACDSSCYSCTNATSC